MSFSEWQKTTLGEIYDFSSGLSKSSKEFGFGFPFLSFKTVFYNYFVPNVIRDLANTTEKEQEKCSVMKGDVFLTRTSETLDELGMSCVALKEYPQTTFNGFTKRLRPKTTKIIDSKFAGYYFRSSKFRNLVTSMATMTTRSSLNNEILSRLPITTPSMAEQIMIGNILYSLDKKIELNNRIKKNIEEIAQAIFKSWFVDFEPFQDGEFEDSDLGMIPEGWRVGILGDILKSIKVSEQSGVHLNELPYVPIDSIPMKSLGLKGFKYGNEAKSSLIRFSKNDIIIGAMRVYFHRVVLSPFEGVTRTTCFVLRPQKEICLSYALSLCNLESTIEFAQTTSKGSTMPYAIWENGLKEMKIVIPRDEIFEKFNQIVFPLIEQVRDGLFENQTLTAIRDSLLPKLMSGEIRVPLQEVQ